MDAEEMVKKYLLREYQHWHLSLSVSQGYLGRAVVWAKRQDALELADATDAEMIELKSILAAYRSTMRNLFRADWMNFVFLGNVDRHLHGHIIPRYSGDRSFEGVTFTDPQWGSHYDPGRITPVGAAQSTPQMLEKLRRAIQEALLS